MAHAAATYAPKRCTGFLRSYLHAACDELQLHTCMLPTCTCPAAGPEVLTVVDFGPSQDVYRAFAIQRLFNPPGMSPPFCSEFYAGGLPHWAASSDDHLQGAPSAEAATAAGPSRPRQLAPGYWGWRSHQGPPGAGNSSSSNDNDFVAESLAEEAAGLCLGQRQRQPVHGARRDELWLLGRCTYIQGMQGAGGACAVPVPICLERNEAIIACWSTPLRRSCLAGA
jgi:hypothetical protein